MAWRGGCASVSTFSEMSPCGKPQIQDYQCSLLEHIWVISNFRTQKDTISINSHKKEDISPSTIKSIELMFGLKMGSARYEKSYPRYMRHVFLIKCSAGLSGEDIDEDLLKLLRNVTSADINDICHFFIPCIWGFQCYTEEQSLFLTGRILYANCGLQVQGIYWQSSVI